MSVRNCACRGEKPTVWVAAWPGVLRCRWCGALLQVSTGRLVECGDLVRPVVRVPLVEVGAGEMPKVLGRKREPQAPGGPERPEGWVYP